MSTKRSDVVPNPNAEKIRAMKAEAERDRWKVAAEESSNEAARWRVQVGELRGLLRDVESELARLVPISREAAKLRTRIAIAVGKIEGGGKQNDGGKQK